MENAYAIVESYPKALSLVRKAVADAGFEIAGEWDVTTNLEKDYGVSLAACRVLTIYCPINLLQNIVMDAAAPLAGHVSVAVCEAGSHARVFLRGGQRELQEKIIGAIRARGARQIAPTTVA